MKGLKVCSRYQWDIKTVNGIIEEMKIIIRFITEI